MRRFVLVGLMVLCCGVARADITLDAFLSVIPAVNQGVAYSAVDSKFNYIATFDVAEWKGFNLEAGYAGVAKNTGDKLVAVISFDLFDAKEAGVTWPIVDLLKFRPGVYAGVGRVLGSNEFDWGVSATVMELKF